MAGIRRTKGSPVDRHDRDREGRGEMGHEVGSVFESTMREQAARIDRRRIVGTAILASMLTGGTTSADLISGWHFNQIETGADWISADEGRGWIDLGGLSTSMDSYQGTDLNAVPGWTPGRSLGFQGSEVEDGSMLLGASLGGMTPGGSLEGRLSFAARRSPTGFDEMTLERWTDAGWTRLEVLDVDLEWMTEEVTFAFDEVAGDLLLRIDFAGATSGAGTIRIDNLRLETTTVPAPGGLALLALAAVSAGGGGRGRDRD